jgi:hypothetical protein
LRISDVSYIARSFTPPVRHLSNRIRRQSTGESGAVRGLAGWLALCDILAVDAAAQYRQLLQLGRDEFLATAAPAALVRYRADLDENNSKTGLQTLTIDQEIEETLPSGREFRPEVELEVFPLTKKPGASFPDRITIGRTANNDIVLADSSVSRLHAYVRRDSSAWIVADAGSKNGSWLRGAQLEARKEKTLASKALLRFGEVEVTFYLSGDLYAALGGL